MNNLFVLTVTIEILFQAKDFTNNPRDILIALEDVVERQPYETCDMASVFNLM